MTQAIKIDACVSVYDVTPRYRVSEMGAMWANTYVSAAYVMTSLAT